ncbi:MAG TPA: DUF2993 domain-containing protein [Kamptonema sp.]|nr:DUF2993 domain-containing protein [Kamptonema sp.]
MTQGNAGLGEQAMNKVAEMAIASQLDESESLSVSLKTDPGQLAQGAVDSVSIDGKGLVMQQDLRMEELELHLKDLSVNPLSAVFGKIELTQPSLGTVRVVLTESDINRAFNSEYITTKLSAQKVHVNGNPVTIDAKSVECNLLESGKFALNAEVLVRETSSIEKVSFIALPQINQEGWGISLGDVEYPSHHELSPELTAALVEKASEILNLRNFDLKGMSVRIQQLDVQPGLLTLHASAKVDRFPSS